MPSHSCQGWCTGCKILCKNRHQHMKDSPSCRPSKRVILVITSCLSPLGIPLSTALSTPLQGANPLKRRRTHAGEKNKENVPPSQEGPCPHESWSAHREYTPKHFPKEAIFEFLKCDKCQKQSHLLHSYSPLLRDPAQQGEPEKRIRVRVVVQAERPEQRNRPHDNQKNQENNQ